MVIEFRIVETKGEEGPWFTYTDFWGEQIVSLFPKQIKELRSRFVEDPTTKGILKAQVRNAHGRFMSLQMRIHQ